MKICKNCQTKLSDNERQCPSCGRNLVEIKPREDKYFVRDRLEKEWAEGTSKRIEYKEKKNNTVLIIGCIVIMLLLWKTLDIFLWIIVAMAIMKLIKTAINNVRGK